MFKIVKSISSVGLFLHKNTNYLILCYNGGRDTYIVLNNDGFIREYTSILFKELI